MSHICKLIFKFIVYICCLALRSVELITFNEESCFRSDEIESCRFLICSSFCSASFSKSATLELSSSTAVSNCTVLSFIKVSHLSFSLLNSDSNLIFNFYQFWTCWSCFTNSCRCCASKRKFFSMLDILASMSSLTWNSLSSCNCFRFCSQMLHGDVRYQ